MRLFWAFVSVIMLLTVYLRPAIAQNECPKPTDPPPCDSRQGACWWECVAQTKGCRDCTPEQRKQFEAIAAEVQKKLQQLRAQSKTQ